MLQVYHFFTHAFEVGRRIIYTSEIINIVLMHFKGFTDRIMYNLKERRFLLGLTFLEITESIPSIINM